MSPELAKKSPVAASDSESSSLSSAPDDEGFSFKTKKFTPTGHTTDMRRAKRTLAKGVRVANRASNGRDRKRLTTQDTPPVKRPRRLAREARCGFTDEAGAGADVTQRSSEKPQKCEGSLGGVKVEPLEASGEESKSRTLPQSTQNRSVRKVSYKAEGQDEEAEDTPKKRKRKQKTKEEKEAEAMPLVVRTPGL